MSIRLRPSADPRAPGIYQTFDKIGPPPLAISNARITGFVGMTQKGPMNEAVRITNWDEFFEIYGVSTASYTTDAIFGFFKNGGSDCWVVRVAHNAPPGELPGLDHASCSEHVQIDDWNKPSLKIRALNEGTWGNDIWFKCVHAPGEKALLTRDLDIGQGEAHVNSTRGFEVGALVRIYDRENSDFVVISDVKDKLVKWGVETPVNRRHRAAAPTYLEVMTFEIHVALKDRREVFKGLQMHPTSRNYAPRVIGQRSRLVRAEDLFTKSPVPHNLPEAMPMTRLSGGRDGIDKVTPEDFVGHDNGPGDRVGLLALAATEEVGLLVAPDAMKFYEREPGPAGESKAQRLQDTMISICENQKDRFAILDIPQSKDIEWVRRWRRRTDSSFCAYYWPWLKAEGSDDRLRSVPPSGHLAGTYATKDRDGVHQAPANIEIMGARDVSLRVTEDHIGVLNADSVNTFRIQRGVRAWGARTASSDPQWRYISVRRLFIMLRRSLEAGFAWSAFEPNTPRTWNELKNRTTAFLAGLHSLGMLAGGNPDEAFFVKCDAETNPPDQVDNGLLVCDIGVAPVAPAEFIMISLVQTMGEGQTDAT
ncbi:MAG TPA: phage tail sheath C-terminal domain-containing protein [Kofleriaceae bacterium]|jgi:phage tail sheath protein FI|nr:phage tail sheath C-terminal domain-containing protein [Kofleriaceae bacterium]